MTDRIDPAFGHWLAGFSDGEGCFSIAQNGNGTLYCAFRIALRHDDEPILREIAQRTGLGKITVCCPPSQSSARAVWYVTRKAECMRLVELFEAYPLRAKKQRDFEIWARAVRDWNTRRTRGNQHSGMTPIDFSSLAELKAELQAVRKAPAWIER